MGCAGYVVGGLRRLCGGSDSDNRASLSSPTGTELGKKTIQTKIENKLCSKLTRQKPVFY